MQLINTYTIEIKKSKFIAYLYDIESVDDAKEALKQLKEEHKKARHIPYAFKVNSTASKSDDKEPSNTAGLPILQMMDYRNLENKLIAVVRYFGGTKLGVGPLMRAYLEAAKKVSE
jgi:uncharacterized YigZ family protein